MGQYHYIVNLTKKQYLHPHKFNDGLKLMEFACSSHGTMMGLAILLAESNGLGGGDLKSGKSLVGSWARDRIVITGDYHDSRLYDEAREKYEDISYKVIACLRKAGESVRCDERQGES